MSKAKDTVKKILTNTRVLFNDAMRGGEYGLKQEMAVPTSFKVKKMKFLHDTPWNIAKKSFKILYRNYTK